MQILDSAFLTSFLVLPMLLVCWPHLSSKARAQWDHLIYKGQKNQSLRLNKASCVTHCLGCVSYRICPSATVSLTHCWKVTHRHSLGPPLSPVEAWARCGTECRRWLWRKLNRKPETLSWKAEISRGPQSHRGPFIHSPNQPATHPSSTYPPILPSNHPLIHLSIHLSVHAYIHLRMNSNISSNVNWDYSARKEAHTYSLWFSRYCNDFEWYHSTIAHKVSASRTQQGIPFVDGLPSRRRAGSLLEAKCWG